MGELFHLEELREARRHQQTLQKLTLSPGIGVGAMDSLTPKERETLLLRWRERGIPPETALHALELFRQGPTKI